MSVKKKLQKIWHGNVYGKQNVVQETYFQRI